MAYTLKNKETIAALADGFFCAMIQNPSVFIGPKTSPNDLKALVALAVTAAEEMAGLCDRYGSMETDVPINVLSEALLVPAYDRPPSHCPDCGCSNIAVRGFQCRTCGYQIANPARPAG